MIHSLVRFFFQLFALDATSLPTLNPAGLQGRRAAAGPGAALLAALVTSVASPSPPPPRSPRAPGPGFLRQHGRTRGS
jgi:hypothetical protein